MGGDAARLGDARRSNGRDKLEAGRGRGPPSHQVPLRWRSGSGSNTPGWQQQQHCDSTATARQQARLAASPGALPRRTVRRPAWTCHPCSIDCRRARPCPRRRAGRSRRAPYAAAGPCPAPWNGAPLGAGKGARVLPVERSLPAGVAQHAQRGAHERCMPSQAVGRPRVAGRQAGRREKAHVNMAALRQHSRAMQHAHAHTRAHTNTYADTLADTDAHGCQRPGSGG